MTHRGKRRPKTITKAMEEIKEQARTFTKPHVAVVYLGMQLFRYPDQKLATALAKRGKTFYNPDQAVHILVNEMVTELQP